jgi:hypothetical protein
MFTNLDFIHTRICNGFLNENNHQEYSVLLITVNLQKNGYKMVYLFVFHFLDLNFF